MAIDPTNYINTWNNSSVLQQQFPDVNDYVALFGSVSTPTSTPIATPTPIIPEQGIPSIINSQMNIDDSGDQGNPPGGNTNTGYGYSGVGGFSLGDIGEGTVAAEDQRLSMKVDDAITGAKATFNNIVPSAVEGIVDLYTKYSPMNLAKKGLTKVGEYTFDKYNAFVNAREARNQVTKDVFNRQMEEQLAADLARQEALDAAAAKAQQIKDYGNYGEAGGSYGGQGNTGTGPGDFHSDDYDMKDGGRVGFADGGMTESSGIYGLLRRGIKNIEEGGLDSLFGERDNLSSEGGVGYSPLQEGDRNAIPKGSKFQPPIYYNPETGTDIGIAPYRVIIDPRQEQSKRYIGTQEQSKRPIKIKDVVPETGLGFEINKGKFTGGVQAPFTKSGLGSANYGIKYSNNPSSSISADYGKDDGLQFRYRKQFKNGGLATMFKLK
jgi:hypothetical protein